MKPGTKAMKVIAKSANSGCVTAPSSSTQIVDSHTLSIVQASATAIAIANFTRTG
jgi:hypothetical protein